MTDASRGWAVPGYVGIEELGSGAQGTVVLARHRTGGPAVAIKYLAPDLLGNAAALDTFRGEAELLRRIVDPHVARLFYYVESPQGAAIVLEAVSGRSLRRVLDDQAGPLEPEAALALMKGSLLGLAAAHGVGVVHRDYKPANVLVQDDGQSKLIDFGIAVLTGQGDRSGTPAYMAPEQWEGQPATPATDLYAVTCVLVECVSGEKPFQGTTLEELRAQHTATPVSLDRVPGPLHSLVQHGLAKNPAERTWNAHEFVGELEALAVREYGPDWERRGLIALGGVYSSKDDFRSAADLYDKAVAVLKTPTAANWNIFYQRGIAYERLKEWPKAEPNFKKALALYPDQPQVLNYLGYSWVDQGMNLKEALAMIQKAVDLRPSDGYIVDSLGWAYFKLGRFDDSVREMERAVSLKPEDPVLNDHLGDAYWRVGRKLEATYQWRTARDLKPDPDVLAAVQRKLLEGLPPLESNTAQEVQKPKPATPAPKG